MSHKQKFIYSFPPKTFMRSHECRHIKCVWPVGNNAITSISRSQIVKHSYTYDETNNIIEYLNSIDGQTSYDYDFLGQLISADSENLTKVFFVDLFDRIPGNAKYFRCGFTGAMRQQLLGIMRKISRISYVFFGKLQMNLPATAAMMAINARNHQMYFRLEIPRWYTDKNPLFPSFCRNILRPAHRTLKRICPPNSPDYDFVIFFSGNVSDSVLTNSLLMDNSNADKVLPRVYGLLFFLHYTLNLSAF